MIICTGPENTGKTTLCKHIADKYQVKLAERYHTLPPVDGDDWVQWAKRQLSRAMTRERVYDRFLIDDLIYGPVMRDHYTGSLEEMAILCNMMILVQPLIILTNTSIYEEEFGEREQYPNFAENQLIQKSYYKRMTSWPMTQINHFTTYDYKEDPEYKFLHPKIDHYLQLKKGLR